MGEFIPGAFKSDTPEYERQTYKLFESSKEYVKVKEELDPLEKKAKSLNNTIKNLMEILKLETVPLESIDTEIKYSVSESVSFDEEKLIPMLRQLAPRTECIKTKEYVDMDVLENEIYHGLLSDEALIAMDTCKEVKKIPKLTIKSKNKKKKTTRKK